MSNSNPTPENLVTTGAQTLIASAPNDPMTELSSCWSRIGVIGGDGTCRELAGFVHCRNCPIHAAVGIQLLNRPLPPSYRDEWTRHYAERKKTVPPGKVSALIFRIAAEWFALPTQIFQEVAEHRLIHSVPHRRQGIVLGLVNIRGELLICVSLARLLGLEQEFQKKQPGATCDRLLVVSRQASRLTFPVDEVQGILRIRLEDLKAVPATVARSHPTYTRGVLPWQGRSVGCLDEELLLSALNRSLM